MTGLRGAIKQYNQVRQLITSIFSLNKGDIPLLSGCEASRAVDPMGFEVDLPGYVERMRQVVAFAQD